MKTIILVISLFVTVMVVGCGGGGGGIVNTTTPAKLDPITFTTEVGYNSLNYAESIIFVIKNDSSEPRAITLKSQTVESKMTTVWITDETSGKKNTFVLDSSLGHYNQEFDSSAVYKGSKWVDLQTDPRDGITQVIPANSSIKLFIGVSKG